MTEDESMKPSPTSPTPGSPRFGANKPIDPEKIKGRSYGSVLLYYREAIFDKIQRSENLNGIITYFFQDYQVVDCDLHVRGHSISVGVASLRRRPWPICLASKHRR